MKKQLLLLVMILLPMVASADAVEINGYYYYLVEKVKVAEITQNPNNPNYYTGDIIIPPSVDYGGVTYSVTSISDRAFSGCNITSVDIPNSVISIGERAFQNCGMLTTINVPNSVTSIGTEAFANCAISSINIPNNLTSLSFAIFMGCRNLTSVTIPNSVTSIGGCAFDHCSNLSSITISENVTRIESHTFYACSSLTSITIPENVDYINSGAFKDCSSLRSINIPDKVTAINTEVFAGCNSLTSITIPDGVYTIGNMAFEGCKSLTSITIPGSVRDIGSKAFSQSGLKTITMGTGVDIINTEAFSKCKELKDFYCYAKDVPWLGTDVFKDSYVSYANLYVYKKMVAKYQAADQWNEFNIVGMPNPEHNLTYYIDDQIYKGPLSIEEEEPITPEPEPTKEGYTFSGWTGEPTVMPEHDVDVKGYFTINKYKLTYMVDDAEYKTYEVEYGATITPEPDPTKEGYTFSGWSTIPTTMPANDVTVTGTFTVNKYKLIYMVDGEEYKSYDIEYGATITPEAEPTKEGYTFSGWEDLPETMPAQDVVVTGTFIQNEQTTEVNIATKTVKNSYSQEKNVYGTNYVYFPGNNSAYAGYTICGVEQTEIYWSGWKYYTTFKYYLVSNENASSIKYFYSNNKMDVGSNTSDGKIVARSCTFNLPYTPSSSSVNQQTEVGYYFKPDGTIVTKTHFTSSSSGNPWNLTANCPNGAYCYCYAVVANEDNTTHEPEPYAVLSNDNKLLTFYYDDQKANRNGMDVGPFSGYPDLPSWHDQRSITSVVFDSSFAGCTTLTSTAYWFSYLQNLSSITDISNLKTDNVTDMNYMFYWCSNLTSLDLSGFKTDNVMDMSDMFNGCSGLTSLDVTGFKTDNVANMRGMFSDCSSLTSLDVTGFKTDNVLIMADMFYGCSGLTSLDVTGFKTDKVTHMGGMFNGCRGLTGLDVTGFKTDNVTNMRNMFMGCSSLTSLDVTGFKTDNVTTMGGMFYGCRGLTSLDVTGFKTDNVVEMNEMFSGCRGLTSLDVTGFKTDNVMHMISMFEGCSGLTSLDLTGFKTDRMWEMSRMFSDCSGLTTIYAGDGWNTENVRNDNSLLMFKGCTNLVGGAGTKYDANHTDKTYARIDGGSSNPGYFTSNKYKLTYMVDDTEYKSYEVDYGATITPEPDPKKEGYTFSGWSTIPATMPANDVTVTGTFTVNKYKLIYMVDGEEYKSYDIEYGATITPEAWPTKEGYTFSGWEDLPETMPAKDVTVTGTFIQNEQTTEVTVDDVTYDITGEGTVTIVGSDQKGDVEIQVTIDINGQTFYVTVIGDYAFKDNQDITSLTIPAGITTIGDNAFNGCINLIVINIGKDVLKIGSMAFANIGSSAAARTRGESPLVVNCYAETVPDAEYDAFLYTPIEDATLLVNDNLVDEYRMTAPWCYFGKIMGFEEASGINTISIDSANARIYDMQGNRLDNPQKGVNIIRMKDGKTKKIIVK